MLKNTPLVYIPITIITKLAGLVLLPLHSTDADSLSLYCNFSCETARHTLCQAFRFRCAPAPGLCHKARFSLTDKIRQRLLVEHNKVRMQTADTIPMLQYDNYLELAAMCHANSLCTVAHDECRRDDTHPVVGQNVGRVTYDRVSLTTLVENILMIFGDWMQGKVSLTPNHRDLYKSDAIYEQYAQIVYENSNAVGCGISISKIPDKYVYLVCNYNNTMVEGEPVYRAGKGCENCSVTTGIIPPEDANEPINLCVNEADVLRTQRLGVVLLCILGVLLK